MANFRGIFLDLDYFDKDFISRFASLDIIIKALEKFKLSKLQFSMTTWSISHLFNTLAAIIAFGSAGFQTIPTQAQSKIYDPPSITSEQEISDTLTENDIPTGEGGFARDYYVQLEKGDQVAIDLTSDNFDSMVTLIAADGATIAENDDGPDGTTNSLLFSRITDAGKYIIRVRAFGETSGGKFTLKLTKLKPTSK
ncbi:MAG: PPC domain-containing protein [Pleurocapsa sp. MO_192.B19]|nr:PPC domain-containing protein [Pleurocapsa sp. MO_192.B19]